MPPLDKDPAPIALHHLVHAGVIGLPRLMGIRFGWNF